MMTTVGYLRSSSVEETCQPELHIPDICPIFYTSDRWIMIYIIWILSSRLDVLCGICVIRVPSRETCDRIIPENVDPNWQHELESRTSGVYLP